MEKHFKELMIWLGVMLLVISVTFVILAIIMMVSYISLIGVNHCITYFDLQSIAPFEIKIIHVILMSIFISVSGIAKSSYSKDIKDTEKSINKEIFSLHHTVEEMSFKISELEEIKYLLQSINENIEEIKNK